MATLGLATRSSRGCDRPTSMGPWRQGLKTGPELFTALSSRNPEPSPGPDLFVSLRFPPSFPRPAGGLSGRPFCRIYFRRQAWVLELEPASGGWIEFGHGDHTSRPFEPLRLHFASLSAAIAYAEGHGFDYRVIPPPAPRGSRRRRGGASRPSVRFPAALGRST